MKLAYPHTAHKIYATLINGLLNAPLISAGIFVFEIFLPLNLWTFKPHFQSFVITIITYSMPKGTGPPCLLYRGVQLAPLSPALDSLHLVHFFPFT